MPTTKTFYNLVFCGPSDVAKETSLVKQAVDHWNLSVGLDADRFVRFSHWKTDATPDLSERPQAVINRQMIDRADILVAVFWERFGTPTGVADSGTQEEILRALKSKKRVLLYFSDLLSTAKPGDIDQFKKVQEFRHDMIVQGLCWSFQSRRDFEKLFSIHLGRVLEEMRLKPKSSGTRKKSTPSSVSQSGLVNVIADGEGDHRNVTVNLHLPRTKPAIKSKYATNSIGADANLVNYIDYLFGLAVEYWEGAENMSAGRLGKKIKTKFRLKLRTRNHLSKDRFNDLVNFIREDLLEPSPGGKRHRRQGTKLCRTYDEFTSGSM